MAEKSEQFEQTDFFVKLKPVENQDDREAKSMREEALNQAEAATKIKYRKKTPVHDITDEEKGRGWTKKYYGNVDDSNNERVSKNRQTPHKN